MCAARVTRGEPPGACVRLLREGALGPVDPAVGPEIRSVQIVGAAGQRFSLEPLLAPVGDAVAVGVGQLPDARRRGDVERAVEPHRAFGQHHAIGKHHAGVEAPVAVLVFEANDPVRAIGELLFDAVVRARRVGDVEPSLVVEVRHDRPIDEGRSGDALDREAGRQAKCRRRGGRLSGACRLRREPLQHYDDQARRGDGLDVVLIGSSRSAAGLARPPRRRRGGSLRHRSSRSGRATSSRDGPGGGRWSCRTRRTAVSGSWTGGRRPAGNDVKYRPRSPGK